MFADGTDAVCETLDFISKKSKTFIEYQAEYTRILFHCFDRSFGRRPKKIL
jgi:hypothetical protein